MPVVDGPAAARMIRETCPLNGGAPILAFTADVDAGLEARFPGLFQGIIRKPLEMAQMLAVISQALASETSEAEASLV